MHLVGFGATCLGAACAGAGLAFHCQYFWGRIEPFWRFAPAGVVIFGVTGAIGFLAAVAMAVQQVLG